MVAGRERQHAALALFVGELGQGIEGPAELECAGALQVFALEEQLRTQPFVGRGGAQHRGVVRHAVQAMGRVGHVGVGGREGGHGKGCLCHGGILGRRDAGKRQPRRRIIARCSTISSINAL